jgi:hypothetical protein
VDRLFDLLQQDLPPFPVMTHNQAAEKQPSVMTGQLLIKPRFWLNLVDDSFWKAQYFQGQIHTFAGGFYLLSQDLADEATREARAYQHIIPHVSMGKGPTSEPHGYIRGIEDYDNTAMVQHHHYGSLLQKSSGLDSGPSVIQWIITPRTLQVFVHPFKKARQWNERFKSEMHALRQRESAKVNDSISAQTNKGIHTSGRKVQTLILVYDTGCREKLNQYRHHMFKANHQEMSHCSAFHQNEGNDSNACNVQYLFGLGNRTSREPPSGLSHNQTALSFLLNSSSAEIPNPEDDVLLVDAYDSDHLMVGLLALSYIQNQYELNAGSKFDVTIFCRLSSFVNLDIWTSNILSTAQYSLTGQQKYHQHLVIGDVRERGQEKRNRELPKENNENYSKFFWQQHFGAHLYLGSECFAISASLIPVVLQSVHYSKLELLLKGNGFLGHDLTYLVYVANEISVHWMPVPRAIQFWYPSGLYGTSC